MPLSKDLLEKLVCPQCKGGLDYKEDQERLICNACKLSYRVSDNIPVLLIDEAEPIQ